MQSNRHFHAVPAVLAAVLLAGAASFPAFAADTCRAVSGPRTVPLVELFTSEGCDSCPPADRWLSAQFPPQSAAAPGIALAYHVNYWDRLGWRDRFAKAQFTQRQRDEASAGAGAIVYTPQILVQGRETRGWDHGGAMDAIAAAERRPPRADVTLDISPGEGVLHVRATASVADPALRKNASVWIAFADSGHVTEVAAGENRGIRLRHDNVVRSLDGPFRLDARGNGAAMLALPLPGQPGSAPTVVAFVQDDRSGDVLQAIALRNCR
jgi:hypothetical protein